MLRETITAALARLLAQAPQAPGVVADVRWGDETHTIALGHADLQRRLPLAADAIFYLYSLTKTYLAALALSLCETEALSLDDRAAEFIPAWPFDAGITLRQLLNHTSGIADYGTLATYTAAWQSRPGNAWTWDDYLRACASAGPRLAPGCGWHYSNMGYAIVRRIIETVTGSPLSRVLQDTITRPLGLPWTFLVESLADAARVTPGHGAFPLPSSPPCDVRPLYHPGWVAHGLIAASVAEGAAFLRALFAGTLVNAHSLAEMTSLVRVPVSHPPFVDPSYGLGLMADPAFPEGLVYGHGGSGPGFSLHSLHWPRWRGRALTIHVFFNADGLDAFLAAMSLRASLTHAPLEV